MVSREDLGLIIGTVSAAALVAGVYLQRKTSAATTYAVTIVVHDIGGLPVAGASVTLGTSLPLPTDVTGTAVFEGFPAGSYTLTVIASGFQTFTESVTVSSDITFPVTLSPAITCTPQPCPCGQTWSSIPPCGCYPQKVASLSAPPTYSFTQSWTLIRQGLWYNPFPTVCGYATPGNPPTCPPLVGCLPGYSGCSPCCGQGVDAIQIAVTAVVKDVNGHPVCGVPVSAGFAGVQQVPWDNDNFSGVFDIILESLSTLSTDLDGEVTFYITVRIANVQSKSWDILQDGPYPGDVQVPFELVLSSAGLVAPVAITMNATLCAYYPTCGALPI